jgi:outer membrane protein TolC
MEAMAAMSRAEAEARESMLAPMLMVRGGVSYMPEGHPLRESALRDGLIGGHGGSSGMEVMKFALSAGAMISLPIAPWSSAGPQAGAEAERLKAQTTLLERDGMKQEMIAMLRSAYSQAVRAQFQVQYYEKTQLPLLEQTLASLRNDYSNGRVPFASVLNGYTMLGMARMESAMKQMEYAMALSMITQLTGISL